MTVANNLTNSKYSNYFKIFIIHSDISCNSCIETLNCITKNHFDKKWLFIILDIEDLNVAKTIAEYTKNFQSHLSLFFTVCPSTDDIQLSKIPNKIGTWIILPKDKLAESNLSENTLIYQLINMIINTVRGVVPKKADTNLFRFSEYFFTRSIQNCGRAYIGLSEISEFLMNWFFSKQRKRL